jgi:hypothetical protein
MVIRVSYRQVVYVIVKLFCNTIIQFGLKKIPPKMALDNYCMNQS